MLAAGPGFLGGALVIWIEGARQAPDAAPHAQTAFVA
jgi:hypothetical protein